MKTKLIVVYSRVSSSSQSLELQVSSAKSYLISIGIDPESDNVRFIHDHDVSAMKISMDDRPGFQEVLSLAEQGKVQTLIVYKRDRIARNFYENIDSSRIFIKHKIQVVFTASNETPFSGKLSYEGFQGIFGQVEGRNIQTRTSDARKQFPPRIYGFDRVKDENDKVTYSVKESTRDIIERLFLKCSKIESADELIELIFENKKHFKSPDQVTKIIQNPFYAAHFQSKNGFLRLIHVEQVVSLDLFQEANRKLDHFISDYLKWLRNRNTLVIKAPFCGLCGKEMKHMDKNSNMGGYYVCGSEHKRIAIQYDLLKSELETTVLDESAKIAPKIAEISINNSIRNKKKSITITKDALTFDYKKANIKLCTLDKVKNASQQINELLSRIKEIQKQFEQVEMDELSLADVQSELSEAIRLSIHLREDWTEYDLLKLVNLLVEKAVVHDDCLQIDLYMAKFMKEVVDS